MRFSREVAFAAARVYARAAETRGLWDARLQALLVDALLRGEEPDVIASRAAALGWSDATPVAVVVGRSPGGEAAAIVHTVYRAARRLGVEVIGGRTRRPAGGGARRRQPIRSRRRRRCSPPSATVRSWSSPSVPTLDEATPAARAALAGYRAAPAWPAAPRPVRAADLLPERALAGDAEARRILRHEVYGSLVRRRRRAAGDAGRVLRRRRGAGERRPHAVRASEHGPLPAAAGRRDHRLRAA